MLIVILVLGQLLEVWQVRMAVRQFRISRVQQQNSPCLSYGRFLLTFRWLFLEISMNILHGSLIPHYARKSKKTDSFMGWDGVPLLHPWQFHVCLQCMTTSDLYKQMQNLIDVIYCILSLFLYLSFQFALSIQEECLPSLGCMTRDRYTPWPHSAVLCTSRSSHPVSQQKVKVSLCCSWDLRYGEHC